MKYNRLHINHFGRLQNRTIEFEDGMHVIYGPNESGKSTLHAFLEAMLFGMERGRGRAAHTDNYHRYYPEEGSSTYGGVLEFTQDDTLYAIYRNFKRNPTGFTLMDETHGRQIEPDEEEYRTLLAGLTLPLYRNTVSLRQLQAATSSELPEQLRSHIVNLRSTGSGSLDLTKTREHLKKQKKQLEAQRDPQAEKQAEALRGELQDIEQQIGALPIPAEYGRVQDQLTALEAEVQQHEAEREELLADIHERQEDLDAEPHAGRGTRGLAITSFLAGATLLGLGIWQFVSPGLFPALPACLLAVLFLAAGFLLRTSGVSADRTWRQEQQELLALRREEETLTGSLLKRQEQVRLLTERRQKLKQSLWKREQLEETLREREEQLDALEPALAHNAAIAEELAAVALASQTIDQLAVTAFDSFGNYLQETASRLIRQITSGRYTRLMIGDDLHITLEQDHQPVELSALSVSTIDQVYLALRIACIDFFWPEESVPLLLDESFAMYDTDRITETLGWLAENYPGQVFLFTCQKREMDILDEARIAHHTILL